MNQENKTYEAYFTNEFARLLSKFKDANSLYEYISQQIEKDQYGMKDQKEVIKKNVHLVKKLILLLY